MESVTCSSAEMTNGDLKPVGSSGHQILIELPERKAIHRIVIRQTNIEDLILYAGASKSQGDWRKVDKIKDNRQTTFKIRQAFVTDRIRMRIGGTMDDMRIAPEYVANASGLYKVNVRRGKNLLPMRSNYMDLKIKCRQKRRRNPMVKHCFSGLIKQDYP